MTVKVIENVSWDAFGFGMIAERLNTDPTTQEDPFVVFTHKLAAAGRYHNGEPLLTAKQEKEVQKDVDALINLLKKFNHTDDYVKVDQVSTRKPRQTTRASETKTTEGVNVKAVAKTSTPSEPEMKSEEPKEAEAPRVKRAYTRRKPISKASDLIEVKKTKTAKKSEDTPVVARRGRKKKEQVLSEAA